MQKVKLSDTQKKIIELLRKGKSIKQMGYMPFGYYLDGKPFNKKSFDIMKRNGLINVDDKIGSVTLTDLGKTIEL